MKLNKSTVLFTQKHLIVYQILFDYKAFLHYSCFIKSTYNGKENSKFEMIKVNVDNTVPELVHLYFSCNRSW